MAIRPITKKKFEDYFKQPDMGSADPRYNQGGERQSEVYPSQRPSAAAAPSRPKPKAAAPARPKPGPLPPRRPQPAPSWPVDQPTPIIPGTPKYEPGPGTQGPGLQMPQFDPMGNPTGQDSPPAPGSSTQGWNPTPQPTDMLPPMTGPGADRNLPGPTQLGGMGSLPQGQSAAGGLMDALAGRFSDWAQQQNAGMPPLAAPPPVPPMTGPGADRNAPGPVQLGGMGSMPQGQSAAGSVGDWFKRTIPPLRF